MSSRFTRIFTLLILVPLLLAAAWTWVTLNWNFSEGERTGYVQKLSKKGWFCKTWEGEIVMVTMPGAIPDKFEFTVPDPAVAKRINALAGKRVILIYEQHKFIPSSCFAETEYFITDVREVMDGAALPSPTVPQGELQMPH